MKRLKWPRGLFEDDPNRPVVPGHVVRTRRASKRPSHRVGNYCGTCHNRADDGTDAGHGTCMKRRGGDGLPLRVTVHDGADCDLYERACND